MKRSLNAWLSLAAGLLATLSCLAGIAAFLLTDAGLLEAAAVRRVDWRRLGIAEEELRGFARETSAYLGGGARVWAPQVRWVGGVLTVPESFTAHMANVRRGAAACRIFALAGGGAAALLLLALHRRRGFSLAGYEPGAALPLMCLLGLGLWAALDFNGMWGWLHRAFIPDGIFPADEPVMLLFPEALFADYLPAAAGLLVGAAFCLLALPALCRLKSKKERMKS